MFILLYPNRYAINRIRKSPLHFCVTGSAISHYRTCDVGNDHVAYLGVVHLIKDSERKEIENQPRKKIFSALLLLLSTSQHQE